MVQASVRFLTRRSALDLRRARARRDQARRRAEKPRRSKKAAMRNACSFLRSVERPSRCDLSFFFSARTSARATFGTSPSNEASFPTRVVDAAPFINRSGTTSRSTISLNGASFRNVSRAGIRTPSFLDEDDSSARARVLRFVLRDATKRHVSMPRRFPRVGFRRMECISISFNRGSFRSPLAKKQRVEDSGSNAIDSNDEKRTSGSLLGRGRGRDEKRFVWERIDTYAWFLVRYERKLRSNARKIAWEWTRAFRRGPAPRKDSFHRVESIDSLSRIHVPSPSTIPRATWRNDVRSSPCGSSITVVESWT